MDDYSIVYLSFFFFSFSFFTTNKQTIGKTGDFNTMELLLVGERKKEMSTEVPANFGEILRKLTQQRQKVFDLEFSV